MIKVGSRVNLIKTITLITPVKTKCIAVSKKNPCKGTIFSMKNKMIAGKKVTMCTFKPDAVTVDCFWEFGLKAFEEIKEEAPRVEKD